MKADWLDDLMNSVKPEGLDPVAAAEILEKYIAQDTEQIAQLEKKSKENQDSGFWGTLRGGTFQAELATTKSQLSYHKKVAKALKELPENKKERERLIANLLAIKKNLDELEQLRAAYKDAADMGQKITIGAQIAAKEVEMNGRRAVVKGAFLL